MLYFSSSTRLKNDIVYHFVKSYYLFSVIQSSIDCPWKCLSGGLFQNIAMHTGPQHLKYGNKSVNQSNQDILRSLICVDKFY